VIRLLLNLRNLVNGSFGIAVKMSGFGGEKVRTHALTPKSGVIPRQILKILGNLIRKHFFLVYNEGVRGIIRVRQVDERHLPKINVGRVVASSNFPGVVA
jgi:hypothetical protein